ncbi:MAG: condensation domain-containing protein, partial [Micromonosporaceae bacterium]
LLRDVPRAYHADIQAVILTAVSQALGRWTRAAHVQLDVERHGREDLTPELDLTRTVGWFSDYHPAVLPTPARASAAEQLAAVAKTLDATPHRGAGYVPLRFGAEPGSDLPEDASAALKALHDAPASEVTVNYLGQLDLVTPDAPATVLMDTPGQIRAGSGARPYLIEVTAGVLDGRLWMVWQHTDGIHEQATIERLATDAAATLRTLASEARAS